MPQRPAPLARLEGVRRTGVDPVTGETRRLSGDEICELAREKQARPEAPDTTVGFEGHGKRRQLIAARVKQLLDREEGFTHEDIKDVIRSVDEDMKPRTVPETARVLANPGISVESHYDKLFDGGFIPKKRYVRIMGMEATVDTESDCWRFHRSEDTLREKQIAEDRRLPAAMRYVQRRMWSDSTINMLSRKRCETLIADASEKFAVNETKLKEEFARIFDKNGE